MDKSYPAAKANAAKDSTVGIPFLSWRNTSMVFVPYD